MLQDAQLTEKIIGAFYRVHYALRHGHLESVYERAMMIALAKVGLEAERQVPVQVWYEGEEVGHFHADIMVERRVILELKATAGIRAEHEAQIINYLCCSKLGIGLLFNFGVQPRFSRFVGPEARRRRA